MAFDAAGASGEAFLASQLEILDPDLTAPLQETTHQRDMPTTIGGGYPDFIAAYASEYTSSGNQQYGLQGTNTTEIAMAQQNVKKGIWPAFNWASGFVISYLDLQKMNTAARSGTPPPFSLQELFEESTKTVWVKMLDGMTYQGFFGYPGLCNNPDIPSFVVPSGGSSTTWVSKTPTQILNDINFALSAAVANSGYSWREGSPNTLLLPLNPQFNLLTQPITIGGVAASESLMSYIKRNCVATHWGVDLDIQPLPNNWISGQGIGNTGGNTGNGLDRGVLYRKDKKSQYLHIGQPMTKGMTVPTTHSGGGYESIYNGNVSVPIFKRTLTSIYLDGI